ncbi:uroporphyrinogen decarboxylase family protein [Chloroflexota bacterium]
MKISTVNHRERMEAFKKHEKIDRIPIALWRHFPVDDQDPGRLAAATLNFQNTFDFDLIKVTPASSFCIKDWGVEDRWEGNPEGTREYIKRVINSPEDWEKLKPLDPSTGFLKQQLECLELMQETRHTTPIIQTIFNPLSQAKNLIGDELLLTHVRQYPDAIRSGLETIATSTKRFIEAATDIGIDGIFFAIQHARSGTLSKDEYDAFGKDHDLEILNITKDLFFNILHLHGNSVYFDEISKYPIETINWHDRETYPSLEEGRQIFDGILCGGMKRETISLGNEKMIRDEISDAVSQTNGDRLLLGTGCVVPVIAPYGNIMAAKKIAEGIPI